MRYALIPMTVKIFLIFIGMVFTMFFLATYEVWFCDFYDEAKANHMADLIGIPTISLVLLVIFITGIRSTARGDKDWKSLIWDTVRFFGLVSLIYWFMVRPVLGGLILMINVHIGSSSLITIQGNVTHTSYYKGSKGSSYELTVNDAILKSITLSTSRSYAKQYHVGDVFEKKLHISSLGIIYGN